MTSPDPPMLSDQEMAVLTEARTVKWKFETYEFAYDSCVRRLRAYKLTLDFLGFAVAIVFLFLMYVATKENYPRTHDILGYIGTGLSLLVILFVAWGLFARWTDQIEKKSELSRQARKNINEHRELTQARPLDLDRIHAWMGSFDDFRDARKHELGALPRYDLIRGFQHVGNSNPDSLRCQVCERVWTHEMNKKRWKAWIPFFHCESCGL